MNPWALIGLLALISAVGAGCFYAGWRSAAAYLPAARAVSDVSAAAVQQANSFSVSLDKTEAALSSLAGAVTTLSQTSASHDERVEDVLYKLFEGLERSGLVRSGTVRGIARQVGETSPPGDAG